MEGVAGARAKRGAMNEHEVSRTLVKSPPELWAECSYAEALGRHLSAPFFGEIRITRLEPETAVAWEGERASGTVRLEPSGWGTRVTLTVASAEPEATAAEPEAPAAAAEPEAPEPVPLKLAPVEPEPPEPEPDPEPLIAAKALAEPRPRRRFFARLSAFFRAPVPQAP